MTNTNSTLMRQLINDEREVPYAYTDSLGYLTIGVGRLIDKRKGGGLSHEECMYLLGNDIAIALAACAKLYPQFNSFSQARQDALANMMFNVGYDTMSTFVNAVACINRGDWAGAQAHLIKSKWYTQVGARATRIIAALNVS